MTQQEITEHVLKAYRQGYQDGMSDRAMTQTCQIPLPTVTTASIDDATAFEMYNQAVANMLSFDGTAQEDIGQTIRRTRME